MRKQGNLEKRCWRTKRGNWRINRSWGNWWSFGKFLRRYIRFDIRANNRNKYILWYLH